MRSFPCLSKLILVMLRNLILEVLCKVFGLLALLLDVKENCASLGDPVYCCFLLRCWAIFSLRVYKVLYYSDQTIGEVVELTWFTYCCKYTNGWIITLIARKYSHFYRLLHKWKTFHNINNNNNNYSTPLLKYYVCIYLKHYENSHLSYSPRR